MVTSNGVGAGHLIRTSAIARELSDHIKPVIFSMAYSAVEVSKALNLDCEYVPSRDRGLMPRKKWDRYLKDRLVALIDETGAAVVTFDGVVPYPGIIAAKFARPHISLIWIRRGMWQKKPQGVLLGLQSKLMDYVIEPGDVARDADSGPTRGRKESTLMNPVTLYQRHRALPRNEARNFLGLDLKKPAVLVQLGVGSSDLDARVSAVFRGISNWRDVQIVMGREPIDNEGNSLLPRGATVKVIRHFPLADLLHAFDAAVCAAGYNSIHEVIPAQVPTLLLANNRGTDDQKSRARWCAENNLALFADNDSLIDIELQASKLQNSTLRHRLTENCKNVSPFIGASEIAAVIKPLTDANVRDLVNKRIHFQRFLAFAAFARSPRFYVKRALNSLLRIMALAFRTLFPHNDLEASRGEVIFSNSQNFRLLDKYIRGQERFEHLLPNSSKKYIAQRKTIARATYGDFEIVPVLSRVEIETHLRISS
jgi:UDP-N-acetylglucosamine:LPS N-acetylglucosamine transferase